MVGIWNVYLDCVCNTAPPKLLGLIICHSGHYATFRTPLSHMIVTPVSSSACYLQFPYFGYFILCDVGNAVRLWPGILDGYGQRLCMYDVARFHPRLCE